MKGQLDNKLGKVSVSTDVISTYAGSVAVECFGIVGFGATSVTDGIVHLLKKEKITKGIKTVMKDSEIYLDFHLIIAYGVNIKAVTDNLIETVKYQVEEFTGLKLARINIFIEGVREID
ncbi:MAG: Asp23/Gls24 family envelope stress response protein [Eubacterium sp.]|nr:Asp23/Gls24 family envelope stress response protein [Eubacterium sp.]